MSNLASKINKLARSIQSDVEVIIYQTASGHVSGERLEIIGTYTRDIEENIQELTSLLRNGLTDSP